MPRFYLSLVLSVMLSTLMACERSAAPSPESIADAPTTTTSSALVESDKPDAAAKASEEEGLAMPKGSDTNPAEIKTRLATFDPAGAKLELTSSQWKERLNKEEFYILRESGTERPGTGDLLKNKKQGIYTCAGCGEPLFSSHSKFESGTGWPSFYQPIEAGRIAEDRDTTLGMTRTEVHCAKCGGHQGHVFRGGPDPTKLRYCINAASMDFVPLETTP